MNEIQIHDDIDEMILKFVKKFSNKNFTIFAPKKLKIYHYEKVCNCSYVGSDAGGL